MIAPPCASSGPGRVPTATKRYLVRAVRPDGGREIVADTALFSEARAFPVLLDARATKAPATHESVEAATGRVVYPEP